MTGPQPPRPAFLRKFTRMVWGICLGVGLLPIVSAESLVNPTFSDADWVSMNPGVAGMNGVVSDIAVDGNGNVYAAGGFTVAGTVLANGIAKWNGSEWSSLGAGLAGGTVSQIEIIGSYIYAAGPFTTAGGVAANQIAKWNGSEWSPLAGGVGGQILALLADGNDLYAGGLYSGGNGYVVKWDGAAWSTIGSDIDGHVYALAKCGGYLYAAGAFNNAGGVAVEGIAKWNGAAWSDAGAGAEIFGTIYALASDGTNLYVGGDFQFSLEHPTTARNIAKWNGSAWSVLGLGLNSNVNVLKMSGSNLYAGGHFTTAGGLAASKLAKWNGSEWSALGDSVQELVGAIAVDGNKVYAGGFNIAGESHAHFIAQWDQLSWSSMGSGLDGGVSELAFCGTDLYVGGVFPGINGTAARNIAKWNGHAWSAVGEGIDGQVSAIVAKGTNLYVGGNFSEAGGIPAKSIAKWNGTAWSALGAGLNGDVYALAFIGNDLYVGGSFITNGGVSAINLAKWNGTSWSPVGTGVNDAVSALLANGTDLYVAGGFSNAGGIPAANVAKWDGSQWTSLGTGVDSHVYALAMIGPDLYAGGLFTVAGGTPAPYVAKWNGSEWSALGTGMARSSFSYVGALVTSGGTLYAAGRFSEAGGVPGTRNISRWDGNEWLAIGTGTDARVTELAVGPASQLILGGEFTLAGSTVSPAIVRADNLLAVPLFSVTQDTAELADGSSVPVDFGSKSVGASLTKTFTISNEGDSDLNLAPIMIDGANSTDFTAGTPADTIVAPGNSTTFTVAYSPAAPGNKAASIHLSGNGVDDVPFDIALTGTGKDVPTFPEIVVEQPAGRNLLDGRSKISFGTVKVGKSGVSKIFTIKNSGTAPLTSISISKDGNHRKDFMITPSGKTSLAPGSSTSFKVKFQPTAKGTRDAWIHIRSNDANENKFDIKLTGLGAAK